MKSYTEQKRKALLKDRGLIYRYPRLCVWTLTIAGVLTFFSKPIYDLMFQDNIERLDLKELRRNFKSRFDKD